ncbi:MAG: hypothetical protein AB1700_05190 [Bacillota bacterium]
MRRMALAGLWSASGRQHRRAGGIALGRDTTVRRQGLRALRVSDERPASFEDHLRTVHGPESLVHLALVAGDLGSSLVAV